MTATSYNRRSAASPFKFIDIPIDAELIGSVSAIPITTEIIIPIIKGLSVVAKLMMKLLDLNIPLHKPQLQSLL